MANHKSLFTTKLLALEIGQTFLYIHLTKEDRNWVPANLIYPRVHRIAKQTCRKFECERVNEKTFRIHRTA